MHQASGPELTRSGRDLQRSRLSYLSSRRPTLPIPSSRVDPLLDIVEAARAGDRRAAATLVVRMRSHTQRIVQKVLGSAHPGVDDVTQDATIALLASLKNFRGESSVVHFANCVTLRVALAARRRINVSQRWLSAATWLEASSETDTQTPLSATIDKRSRDVISRILGELPPAVSEVLTLNAILGYTTAEVALMLQVSRGTVRSHLRTGKKEFRRLMRRERRRGYSV